MDKKILFLIIFGMFMFGIRLANINEAIYDDEAYFAYAITVMDIFGFNYDFPSPQPLNVLYQPFIAFFGLETWVFRIIPWLFGIINTVFVYFFARRNWDEKVAFWATLLMLVGFYPTLASLQFDVEGNLIMFSALLLFFSYFEFNKARLSAARFKWKILAGIGLGLAVYTKYNSIYLIVVLGLYILITKHWDLKESIKNLFPIYTIGLILFLFLTFLGILVNPSEWTKFVYLASWFIGFNEVYRPQQISLLALSIYILWSTPLLFGFYIISIFKRNKEVFLLIIWITIALLFYTFGVTYGSMDRYLMSTIPALAILGGYYISRLPLKKIHYRIAAIILIVWTISLFWLNTLTIKYISRFPELYLQELKRLNLHFLFTYTSASGPTFGINFATIFWSFFLAYIFLFSCLLTIRKKRNISLFLFVSFVAIAVSFNIFLTAEYLFHPTGADVSSVKHDMIKYVKDNQLSFPIYSNDKGLQWYFENNFWINRANPKLTVGVSDYALDFSTAKVREQIVNRGGTFLLLHWPPLPEKSPLWEVLPMCQLHQQFTSKQITIGEIYLCAPHSN